MSGSVKIDTRSFVQMTRELARRAGVPDDVAMIAEIGKVLEKTVAYTPAASKGKIALRFRDAQVTSQPSDLYSPQNPRSGVKISKNGFISYYLRNRYPDNLWALITARRNASFAAKIKAIGLAKKSWVSIAKRLGIDISAPAYAKTAIASTGKEYPEDTSVSVQKSGTKLQISIYNSQPTANLTGGDRALQAAVDGRTKYFLGQMALGTFNKAATIAKQYPGIKIT